MGSGSSKQKNDKGASAEPAGMPENGVVVVFGGLGRQGSSVASGIAKAFPKASIRIVTRNAESESAKAVCKGNVTVHQANMGQPETLKAVLDGAYAVFLVTQPWPKEADGGRGTDKPLDWKYEKECALNVITACKAAGVKHLIYSALEDTSKVKGFNENKEFKPFGESELVVPHFDGKGQVMALLNEQKELPVDFVMLAFYYGNWFAMKPAKGEDGQYALYLPLAGKRHFMTSVGDTGNVVAPLLKRKPVYSDGSWPSHGVVGAAMTGDEIAKAFSEVCLDGAPVNFVDVPVQAFKEAGVKVGGMPPIVANDLGNMFGFYNTDYCCKARQEAFDVCADKNMVSFRQWLGQVKDMLYC